MSECTHDDVGGCKVCERALRDRVAELEGALREVLELERFANYDFAPQDGWEAEAVEARTRARAALAAGGPPPVPVCDCYCHIETWDCAGRCDRDSASRCVGRAKNRARPAPPAAEPEIYMEVPDRSRVPNARPAPAACTCTCSSLELLYCVGHLPNCPARPAAPESA